MAGVTLILKHFQDVFTRKFPFDQITKSQEDDQYYEDPLECKNIHERPQGAKNQKKIKEIPQDLKSFKVNPREEKDTHQKGPAQQHQDHSQFHPLKLWKCIHLKILSPHY
ncbi:hypothetical protein O181_073522 [Austropuccinia psidii MF-1]|uniref:Uncharacterized protein n=1 Tax=Austropuccinia psidii MF-1 TaxID=1389203 RepID=A0A9Q3FBD6_9BASI|nr:hypothetical protein [Austropuccinia psidii MF-1]